MIYAWLLFTFFCLLLGISLCWLICRRGAAKRDKELAERIEHVKEVFLSNISHQLRTPLNGVRGLSQSLTRKLTKRKDHQECLKAINISSQHLERIICAILDFTRLHGKGVDLHEEPCNVRDLLEQAALLTWLPRGHVSIFTRCDPKIGWIIGDATRIRQIVGNFIGNASKFTFGGTVDVSAELAESGTMLELKVADTGIGIPGNQLEFLFQRSFRVSPVPGEDLTDDVPGTGLGLPICQRLAAFMGGTVKCESVLKKGSSFFVTIPFRPSPPSCEADREHISSIALKNVTIALITTPIANGTVALVQQLQLCGVKAISIRPQDVSSHLEANNNAKMILVAHTTLLGGISELRNLVQQVRRNQDAGERKLALILIQLKVPAGTEKESSFLSNCAAVLIGATSERRQLLKRAVQTLTEPVQSGQLRLAVARCLSYLHSSEPLDSILVRDSISPHPSVGMIKAIVAQTRVLVAEDNVINQRVICQSLKLCGVQEDNIVVAENGSLAFEQFAARASCPGNSFDICIIDVHMPVLNGLQLARKIHQYLSERCAGNDFPFMVQELEKSLPFLIAHSASALPEDRKRCQDFNFDLFLPKPLVLRALNVLLQNIAAWRSQRSVSDGEMQAKKGSFAEAVHLVHQRRLEARVDENCDMFE